MSEPFKRFYGNPDPIRQMHSIIFFLIVFSGLVALVYVLALGMAANWIGVLVGIGVLLFLAFLALPFYDAAFRDGLLITDQGIGYQTGGMRVFARWDAIERLESRLHGEVQIWGLTTRQAPTVTRDWTARLRRVNPPDAPFDTFILIGAFMPEFLTQTGSFDVARFRESEAGQTIERFAPHVFDAI